MARKKKATAKTLPMRILEEKGIAYKARPQARKQLTAEDGSFALVVIPGDRQLSLKKFGTRLGDKNVQMASQRDVQRVTGFQVGAVSVLGYRRDDVPAYLDEGVLALERAIISSGRADMGLQLVPHDLLAVLDAQVGDFSS